MRHAKHAPKPHPVEQRPAPALTPLHVAGQRTTVRVTEPAGDDPVALDFAVAFVQRLLARAAAR